MGAAEMAVEVMVVETEVVVETVAAVAAGLAPRTSQKSIILFSWPRRTAHLIIILAI